MSVNAYSYIGMVLCVKDKIQITEESHRCSNATCPRRRMSLDVSERFCKHCGNPVEPYKKTSLRDFEVDDFFFKHGFAETFSISRIEGTSYWIFDDDRVGILIDGDDDSDLIPITPEKIAEFTKNFRKIPEYIEFDNLLEEHLGKNKYTLDVRYGIYWN